MKKLYLNPDQKELKIPIYRDKKGNQFLLASLSESAAILFREIIFTEDNILVFYGDTFRESEVEVIVCKVSDEDIKDLQDEIINNLSKQSKLNQFGQ